MMKNCRRPSPSFPDFALLPAWASLVLALLFAFLGMRLASAVLAKLLLWASVASGIIFLFVFVYSLGGLPCLSLEQGKGAFLYIQNVPLLFGFLNLLYIFFPFFVSDDALRHIHDGYYLLQGVDVYRQRPADLPPLGFLQGQMPNHPELGTIYLPFTQLLSLLGAMLGHRYGFLFLYHGLCSLAFWLFWKNAGPIEKKRFFVFFFSPWIVFLFAGHHADALGLVLVLALWVGLRGLFPKNSHVFRSQAGAPKRCVLFWTKSFLWGTGLVFLPALKPEGFFWAAFLFVFFVLKYFARTTGRALLTDKKKLNHLLGFVCFGMGSGLLFLSAFSAGILWKNPVSLQAFLHTIRIFAGWFVAYNPFVEFLALFWKEASRPEILEIWRIGLVALGGFLFFLHFFSLKKLFRKREYKPERQTKKKPFLSVSLQKLLQRLPSLAWKWGGFCRQKPFFRTLLLQRYPYRKGIFVKRVSLVFLTYSLLVSILSKGAWNPWYFSWLLPVFLIRKKKVHVLEYSFFISLALCYLPVVDLRFLGRWGMQEFYLGFGIFWMMLFFVYSSKKRLARKNTPF